MAGLTGAALTGPGVPAARAAVLYADTGSALRCARAASMVGACKPEGNTVVSVAAEDGTVTAEMGLTANAVRDSLLTEASGSWLPAGRPATPSDARHGASLSPGDWPVIRLVVAAGLLLGAGAGVCRIGRPRGP